MIGELRPFEKRYIDKIIKHCNDLVVELQTMERNGRTTCTARSTVFLQNHSI